MKLREWLDARIDVASARHDADNTTVNVVNINQKMLADVTHAVMLLDARIEAVETALGFDLFEVDAKGRRVR